MVVQEDEHGWSNCDPRVKVGDTVYRVDWKEKEAVVLEYTLVSQSPGHSS
jgi:hypothetical protein